MERSRVVFSCGWLLAIASRVPVAAQSPPPALALGTTRVELENDAQRFGERGPALHFGYQVPRRCVLYLSAFSSEFDPVLRIENSRLAEPQDCLYPGLGKLAYLNHIAEEGDALTITVAAGEPGWSGELRVDLVAVDSLRPEDELELQAIRAEAARVSVESPDMTPQERQRLLSAATEGVLAIPGAARTHQCIVLLYSLHEVANKFQVFRAGELAMSTVFEFAEQTLCEEHPLRQKARSDQAFHLWRRGDLRGALDLETKVLEVLGRTLPPDHEELQKARHDLACTLENLGDLHAARKLEEQALEVLERTVPEDQPLRLNVTSELALIDQYLGDLHAARAMSEKALALRLRTEGEDSNNLQRARLNFATILMMTGDFRGARALLEQVVAARSQWMPPDHPELLSARTNLAFALLETGEPEASRSTIEQALAGLEGALPAHHHKVQAARTSMAAILTRMGEYEEARELLLRVLALAQVASLKRDIEAQVARVELVDLLATMGELDAARDMALEAIEGEHRTLEEALTLSSPREAERLASEVQEHMRRFLSLSAGRGDESERDELQAGCFALLESARAIGLRVAALARLAAGDRELDALRSKVAETSAEVARRALNPDEALDLAEPVRARDRAQRALTERVALGERGRAVLARVDSPAVALRLAPEEAAVSYLRFSPTSGASGAPAADVFFAFVVRPGRPLARVELGPAEPIVRAVERWREAAGSPVGSGESARQPSDDDERVQGAKLRELVLDPLLPALGGVQRLVVVLDDELHLVPLDALPDVEAGSGRVGDRMAIHVRSSLWELCVAREESDLAPSLLAFGAIDYWADPEPLGESKAPPGAAAAQASAAVPATGAPAAVVRKGPWERGFWPLPDTSSEVRALAVLFEEQSESAERCRVLLGRQASKRAFQELAPGARFLHLATHGYFAAESVGGNEDSNASRARAPWLSSHSERVHQLSPMVLCGVALAGANRPADALGRIPGILTAEELGALDLARCELAVLSACKSNVGLTRAGQGVASMQRGLHMAGARSVVTSLWDVPDSSARELMVDFYRRIWIQKKPKAQALWEAKRKLRNARDEFGRPAYRVRDWGGWMLSGDPD